MRQLLIFVAQTAFSWTILAVIVVVTALVQAPPYDGAMSIIGGLLFIAVGGVITNTVAGFEVFEPLYPTGWLMTAFAIVHTWWPRAWTPGGADDRQLERKLAAGRALLDITRP